MGKDFVACRRVGGKTDHTYRSQAKKDAHKVQRARGRLKEVVRKVDITRTTFGRQKENSDIHCLPKSAKELKKGQFETIPGTRIQNGPDGQPVRLAIESGKLFPPKSTFACKQHLLKLAKERQEAEEIARMRGDKVPDLPPGAVTVETLRKASTKKEKRAAKKRKKGTGVAEVEAAKALATEPLTKRERKQQDREAKQKKLEDQRKAASERKLLAEGAWHKAEVSVRDKGFAWLRLATASDEVAAQLRAAGGGSDGSAEAAAAPAASGTDDTAASMAKVRLWFFDVAEQGVNLQPGAKLSVQLYSDEKGIGACNAKAAAGDAAEAAGQASPAEPTTTS